MTSDYFLGCRCTRDGGRWEFYRSETGGSDAKHEMYACLDEGTPLERTMRKAELYDLLSRARSGELVWDDDVKHVVRHPAMLELRWEMTPFQSEDPPVLQRMYFAEPEEAPAQLLALLFHRKAVRGTGTTVIREDQNVHMGTAELRRLDWLRRVA